MENVFDLAEEYADDFIESEDFKRLIELKEIIKKQLSGKIISFKTKEAKYIEAKKYGKYHPDLERYQSDFVEAKKSLYNEPLIIEYKKTERKLQEMLDSDMNSLKKVVSNKFPLKEIYKF